jgi:hypothetical protein
MVTRIHEHRRSLGNAWRRYPEATRATAEQATDAGAALQASELPA